MTVSKVRIVISVAAFLTLWSCKHTQTASEGLADTATNSCSQAQSDLDKAKAELKAAQDQQTPAATQNANCTDAGGTVGTDGTCRCADGTAVFKMQGQHCPATTPAPTITQNANCTDAGGTVGTDGVCRCPDSTPVYKMQGQSCAAAPAQNDNCTSQKGVVNSAGDCVCSDGTPVFKLHGGSCPEPTAAVQNENCSASGGTVGTDGTCRCADGTAVFKLPVGAACTAAAANAPDLTALQKKVTDLDAKLQACKKAATPDLCTAAQGKLDKDNVCRCSDNTPVYQIGNSTCSQYIAAKPNPDLCTKAQGKLDKDNVCRCSDSTPVYKIGNSTCSQYIAAHQTHGTTTTPAQPSSCVCGMTGTFCAIGIPGQSSLGWTPATTCTVAQCQLYFANLMVTTCKGIWYHGREK